MKKRLILPVRLSLVIGIAIIAAAGTLLLTPTPSNVLGQARSGGGSLGWRVWVKTSPCSGRFDWLTVAQGNPTGGGNTFAAYETLLPLSGCTETAPSGCTFAAADALRNSLRFHPKFLDLCCRDYSVWENSQTGKRTVVLGKLGTAGFTWRFVKGQLCCEEAEALAGIPGACSDRRRSGWGPTNESAGLNGKTLTFYRGTTPEQCQADCGKNPACRAFTFIRAGAYSAGDPQMCYLMSEATGFAPSPCCISAVKSGEQGGGVVYPGEGNTIGLINKPQVVELPDDADDSTPGRSDPAPDRPSETPNTPGLAPPVGGDQSGSLKLVATEIRPSTKDDTFTYTRGPTSASAQHQFEPGNLANALIQWNFSGAPGSLNPGQEFTITISGSVTRGARFGESPTATVFTQGLEVVKAEPAVMNTDVPFRGGKYVFRVPADAAKVTISFQADYNIGTFATYRYER